MDTYLASSLAACLQEQNVDGYLLLLDYLVVYVILLTFSPWFGFGPIGQLFFFFWCRENAPVEVHFFVMLVCPLVDFGVGGC